MTSFAGQIPPLRLQCRACYVLFASRNLSIMKLSVQAASRDKAAEDAESRGSGPAVRQWVHAK
jgi:hypothetical protein